MSSLRLIVVASFVVITSSIAALFFASSLVKQVAAQSSNPAINAQGASSVNQNGSLPQPENFVPSDEGSAQGGESRQDSINPSSSVQQNFSDDGEESNFSEAENATDGVPNVDNLKTDNPEGYVYDPSGRRDPFLPANITPLNSADKNQSPVIPDQRPQGDAELLANPDPLLAYYSRDYRLVGVLWDVRQPKAMIRDPNGGVYTLKVKTRLGREGGAVAAIRENEVIVAFPDSSGHFTTKSETFVIRMRN